VKYIAYRRIYEKFSFLTRPRARNGRTLRHSRGMSGSAGLSPSRNRKPEGSTSSAYAPSLRKECVGLVAGQAVLTVEIRTANFPSFSLPPRSSSISPSKSSVALQNAVQKEPREENRANFLRSLAKHFFTPDFEEPKSSESMQRIRSGRWTYLPSRKGLQAFTASSLEAFSRFVVFVS